MLQLHDTHICVSNIQLLVHALKSCEDLKAVLSKRLLQLWSLMSVLEIAVNVPERHEHRRPDKHCFLLKNAVLDCYRALLMSPI